ncbi:TetR/AcrR family transcriptional regulator [Microlunatus soli]|uniref:DNA-binding transcriptional regulator, AcrR family n=1 Tax=Microlunatus soli TaxID=630515 RepID=A0A1H1V542_9ACTN|nr:TetR/AcrR family transcriptional regulator [Microlunatus soli]SDS79740.1 DNA-binding transcriptional regulator, AcrR family [Microlunatus soli]
MTKTAASTPAPSARRAQTRDRLMAGAVGVFAERGIIGASVEEICEAAGFTRGAFYSNFTDKDDLVLAMVQRDAEDAREKVREISVTLVDNAAERGNQPGMLINLALSTMFGDVAKEPAEVLARHEMDLYAIRRPELRAPYSAYLNQLYDSLGHLVEQALTAIGIEFTVDYRTAISMLHACASRIELTALLTESAVDPGPMEALLTAISRPVGQDGCTGS